MLDYSEVDGTRFEQLVRELLLVLGLAPRWSGEGPDQGRDIIATESFSGPVSKTKRVWLVQCKNTASAIGRPDLASVVTDCQQIGADGYLLVCSKNPTSSAVQLLEELDRNGSPVTRYWDGVELEKRLNEPRAFGIAQMFFPKSLGGTPWRVYNAGSPSIWAAHYRGHFIYLCCRDGATFPCLSWVEPLVARFEKLTAGEDEYLRLRAVYFDDKHCQLYVFSDYLHPANSVPTISPLQFSEVVGDGYCPDTCLQTLWEVRRVTSYPSGDHFHVDHHVFYEPYIRNFREGTFRDMPLSTYVFHGGEWSV